MSRLTFSLPTRILFIILCLFPLQMQAQLRLGIIAQNREDLHGWREDSKLRRAALETNGKDWFMKYAVRMSPDSAFFDLLFLEGNYVVAYDAQHLGVGLDSIFYSGLKKAVNKLAVKKDTLFLHDWDNRYLDENLLLIEGSMLPPWFIRGIKIDYDGVKYAKNLDILNYIKIRFNKGLPSWRCINKRLLKRIGISYPESLNKYIQTGFDKNILPVQSEKDAEDLYILINKFDDFMISLPSQPPHRMKVFDWGYSPGKHKNQRSKSISRKSRK